MGTRVNPVQEVAEKPVQGEVKALWRSLGIGPVQRAYPTYPTDTLHRSSSRTSLNSESLLRPLWRGRTLFDLKVAAALVLGEEDGFEGFHNSGACQ